jgi:beta-galactosidase/beta-glucuronidase
VTATTQDGSYPRPTMCREQWSALDGRWEFAWDDEDRGLAERWHDIARAEVFTEEIVVPFPPESPASGLGRREFHPVVWYARSVTHRDFVPDGAEDRRVILHFGAVDHDADVWVDGHHVARHSGGQTPFSADVTNALASSEEHRIVVRAEDDPVGPDQARGKQDWRERTRGIWYERTTGIWQSVWAECVAVDRCEEVWWDADVSSGLLHGQVLLSRRPRVATVLEVTVRLGEEVLAEQTTLVHDRVVGLDVRIDALRHGQDRARLLWSPEQPTLVDVALCLRDHASGQVVDEVASYAGLRVVSVDGGVFRLNDQPYYVRSVLDQGYRPETHLASRSDEELRREVETIKALGFNSVRIHQKCEDPRWLFWADRLGLLVWGESASAYAFSASAVEQFVTEWMAIVRRDRSHPCVVAWVPVNESWGVQDIAGSAAQQNYARSLAALTRSLDPSRPVLSNEGWEHVDSDILGLHDYSDAEEMGQRYADRSSIADVVLRGRTPHGRRPILSGEQERAFLAGETPLMITEFGGISLVAGGERDDAWGYSNAGSADEYADLLRAQFEALRASAEVVGYCYTQFMDTGQETNGLLFADGTPKLPVEVIREIVTGESDGRRTPASSTVGWVEQ